MAVIRNTIAGLFEYFVIGTILAVITFGGLLVKVVNQWKR